MENAIRLEVKTSEENAIKQYIEGNATAILIDKINNGYELDGVKYNKNFAGFMKYACDMARKQSADPREEQHGAVARSEKLWAKKELKKIA